ncbi:MAG: hypothetical protein ACW98X_18190 [Promethearchaeota archaeon]|jgi:hypothetical protein
MKYLFPVIYNSELNNKGRGFNIKNGKVKELKWVKSSMYDDKFESNMLYLYRWPSNSFLKSKAREAIFSMNRKVDLIRVLYRDHDVNYDSGLFKIASICYDEGVYLYKV